MEILWLLLVAAAWESVLYLALRRFARLGVVRHWWLHLLVRCLLGLIGYGVLRGGGLDYAAAAASHGMWLGWTSQGLVLVAFVALISGAVFNLLTVPLALIYLLKGRR